MVIRFLRCQRGAHVAELAVILPLIIFITAASMILSITVWTKIVVTDATREGARYVALGFGADATPKVKDVLAGGNLNEDNIHDVITTKDSNYVTVTVQYKQPAIIPKLPELLGGSSWGDSFLIESTQVFKLEKT